MPISLGTKNLNNFILGKGKPLASAYYGKIKVYDRYNGYVTFIFDDAFANSTNNITFPIECSEDCKIDWR